MALVHPVAQSKYISHPIRGLRPVPWEEFRQTRQTHFFNPRENSGQPSLRLRVAHTRPVEPDLQRHHDLVHEFWMEIFQNDPEMGRPESCRPPCAVRNQFGEALLPDAKGVSVAN
jgi:hypothetical protein